VKDENRTVRKVIEVELTNVSRKEQKELRDYLVSNCWAWSERVKKYAECSFEVE
jgi:hypothetical protein